MKNLITLSVIVLFTFISCNKLDIAEGSPKCLKKEINEFKKGSLCDDAEVSEYLSQGNKVYILSPGTCDSGRAIRVIDANCNTISVLGGFTGNTEINGEEFSEATFIRTVWEK